MSKCVTKESVAAALNKVQAAAMSVDGVLAFQYAMDDAKRNLHRRKRSQFKNFKSPLLAEDAE